ncbi:MAG: hypothetical protein IJ064_03895 [Bacteroidaceae bacterium]|nr:hypothetical protein [Bacteroidaceae bacterium]
MLLIYAEEDTSETEEKLKNDHELYTKFYNAFCMDAENGGGSADPL